MRLCQRIGADTGRNWCEGKMTKKGRRYLHYGRKMDGFL